MTSQDLQSSQNQADSYRPDIDGLRAIAVLSVVIHHFFPSILKGGYLGVDIFFVISGFLITNIIVGQIEENKFSLKVFYVRRIKRIFPALITVLLTTLILGWFSMWPDEYKNLGNHVFGASIFISNFILWKEVGYFDPAGIYKPLLHLWSLSVEEQFYIFWPILLVFVHKKKVNMLWVITGVIVLSLASVLYLSSKDPSARFYFPITRAWEFSFGAALVFLPKLNLYLYLKKYAKLISFTGITFIFLGLIWGKSFAFAVPVVLGAAAVIGFSSETPVGRYFLSLKPMIWIGLISYPLYLWHYVLLSFYKINLVGIDYSWVRILLLIASLILAVLTYYFIERPIRFSKKNKEHVLLACMSLLLLSGIFVNRLRGLESRFEGNKAYKNYLSIQWKETDLRNKLCLSQFSNLDKGFCLKENSKKISSVALIGDSHANHFYYGINEHFPKKGMGLIQIGEGGCVPFLGLKPQDQKDINVIHCPQRSNYLKKIKNDSFVKTVILGARGPLYIFGNDYPNMPKSLFLRSETLKSENNAEVYEYAFKKTVSEFLKAEKQVIFIIDNPEMSFEPKQCINLLPVQILKPNKNPCAVSRKSYDDRNKEYLAIVNRVSEQFPEMKVFNAADQFCDKEWCWAMKDSVMLYRDDDHLSKTGSLLVGKAFGEFMDNLEKEQK